MTDTGTLEERNQRIEAEYLGGTTMQDIGDRLGVTRARVQQILKARGVDTGAGRAARRLNRRQQQDAEITAFWDEHGDTVIALANDGASKAEVGERFRILFPAQDLNVVSRALDASEVVFSKQEDAHHFPASALRFGVLYCAGLHYSETPDAGAALASLDTQDIVEVEAALRAREFDSDEIAAVLGTVAVVQERVRDDVVLTKNRYMELRRPFSERPRGAAAHAWPADAQTVMRRLGGGYWDDAMREIGLGTSGRGRSRGLLVFSEAEYTSAVSDYRLEREALRYRAGTSSYDGWRARELQGGRSRPSLAAIIDRFGTWQAALRSVIDQPVLAAQRRREALPGARLLHASRADAQHHLSEFDAASMVSDRDNATREFLLRHAQTFEIDRRVWFRALVGADSSAGPRRAAQSKRGFRGYDALVLNPSAAVQTLDDTYLDNMLSSSLDKVDGWFSEDVEAALAPLSALDDRYVVLREARNFVTHVSDRSTNALRTALEIHGATNRLFRFSQPLTLTTLLRWFAANDGARLRELASLLPSVWTVMVAAEGVVRAEQLEPS